MRAYVMDTMKARWLMLILLPALVTACGNKDQGDDNAKPTHPGNGSNTAGGSSDAANYPKVTPPVKSATPNAFKGAQTRALTRASRLLPVVNALDANAFISRFFSAGPTELFNVLANVDGMITGIQGQAAMNDQNCLHQTPVAYEMVTPGGNVTMYAQCYEEIGPQYTGDPGFLQWALVGDTFYIYSASGVGWTAAIASPPDADVAVSVDGNATAGGSSDANATVGDPNSSVNGSTAVNAPAPVVNGDGNAATALDLNDYVVHAWYSVGLNNFTVTYQGMDGLGWFNGSYCIAEIYADPQSNRFEMTAAGGGIGFCGAQFVSDGNDVFGIGSVDMGVTCNATATVCLDANTGLPQTDCSIDQNSFVLPPLGRQGAVLNANNDTWGASDYPGNANNHVVLNGNDTDSAHFGPGKPTAGAGLFATMQASGNNAGNGNVTANGNVCVNANLSTSP